MIKETQAKTLIGHLKQPDDWFGLRYTMTLRDRQRAYYYARLDESFPGLRSRYEKTFGEGYFAPAQNARTLEKLFHDLCREYGIAAHMPFYERRPGTQPRLF